MMVQAKNIAIAISIAAASFSLLRLWIRLRSSSPGSRQSATSICQDGYQQVFFDYQTIPQSGVWKNQLVGAATIDNSHYMTYTLVNSAAECLSTCDNIKGCVFANVLSGHPSVRRPFSSAKICWTAYLLSFTPPVQALHRQQTMRSEFARVPGYTSINLSNGYCKSSLCFKDLP